MTRIIPLEGIQFTRKLLIETARFFSKENGTCLLYSGPGNILARHSFLCLFPYDTVWIQGQKRWRATLAGENRTESGLENPWDALKSFIPPFDKEHPYPEYIGFFGYEMGAFSDPGKALPYLPSLTPEAYFQRCALVIAIDHQTEKAVLVHADQSSYFLDEEQKRWTEQLCDIGFWPEFAKSLLSVGSSDARLDPIVLFKADDSLESYCKKVAAAKELIRSGDIYQVNLSQQFQFSGHRDPYNLFVNLAQLNPAPFSVYLRIGGIAVVSTSPEQFLKSRQGILETRPIKGTVPRGSTPEEDLENREALLASPKEKAELLMIIDLMRNDLGKVSQAGSVQTAEIWGCEAYANVYHLVATIRSKVLSGLHPVDIIRSCFPGGSITGCPKLSAMEVIADLEKRPRGIYTGSIGYFAGNGDFDLNIAIRTMVIHEDTINLQLGGAIVADSNPEMEYEETLHKGASIFQALGVPIEKGFYK